MSGLGHEPVSETPKAKPGFGEAFSGLPAWAWIFIVGCIALPIINLGGAIPGALGFGGAAGCASVAKKTEWSTATRALVCAGVTGGIWILWIVFAVVVFSLRS